MAGCCLYGAMLMGMFLRKYEVFNSLRLSDPVLESEDNQPIQKQAKRDLPGLDRFEELAVSGMTCASCARSVEASLTGIEGVKRANVDAIRGLAQVVYDRTRVRRDQLIRAVEHAGFVASLGEGPWSSEGSLTRTLSSWNYGEAFTWSLFCIIPMLLAQAIPSTIVSETTRQLYILILAGFVQFGFGFPFHRKTWIALSGRHGLPMDVLVSASTTIAYVVSVFSHVSGEDTSYALIAASLISVLSLGRHLESKAKTSISDTLKAFTDSVPLEARAISEGSAKLLPVQMLREGDLVVVEPGERFPCDGKLCSPDDNVYADRVEIDESFHTGEARPVTRTIGELCLAGTRNSGRLPACIRITSAVEATDRLKQVLKTLLESHRYKSKLQGTVEKAMTYMVPGIMLLAATSFGIWLLVGSLGEALQALVATLAVACPCALGLSTPVALTTAIATSSKFGIILKRGAQAVEALARATTVVFDKTGTITDGRMSLKRCEISRNLPPELQCQQHWWQLVHAAEQDSSHWVATAIAAHLQKTMCSFGQAKETQNDKNSLVVAPGRGISCVVDGIKVVVGNQAHLESLGISDEVLDEHARSLLSSESCVLVAFGDRYAGLLTFEDRIATNVRDTIGCLKARGTRVCMMTGDRQSVGADVAKAVDIDSYYAGMTPQAKADAIRSIKDRGETVAMVGDGINDAMALSVADVGIALNCGAPLTVASADLVLLSSSIKQVLPAIDMAKAVHETINMNVRWAVCYNALLLPLAMGALRPWGIMLHPTLGGALMMISSLGVTYSSVRLEKELAYIFSGIT